MTDLRLDVEELKQLYLDLLNVSTGFSSIDQVSKNIASAVGHDALEAKVRDFATKWDDRRQKIITSVDAVAESARSIATTFRDVDKGMADALDGKK